MSNLERVLHGLRRQAVTAVQEGDHSGLVPHKIVAVQTARCGLHTLFRTLHRRLAQKGEMAVL